MLIPSTTDIFCRLSSLLNVVVASMDIVVDSILDMFYWYPGLTQTDPIVPGVSCLMVIHIT